MNAFTGWILHTAWLRRLADHQVLELRYTTRSGRPVKLPVMYAQHANMLVVLVGGPQDKNWWRHFRHPQPVEVLLRGVERTGDAHVAERAAADRPAAQEVYAARFPDIPVHNDPLIVINLHPLRN